MMFKGRMKRESFHWVSRVFERSSKGISEQFEGGFKDVLRKFHGHSLKASSTFQWCFKED